MQLLKAKANYGPTSPAAAASMARVDADIYTDARTGGMGFGGPPPLHATLGVSGTLTAASATAARCGLAQAALTIDASSAGFLISTSTDVTVLHSADASGVLVGSPVWAGRIGGGATDYVYSVAVDSQSNIFAALRYNSTAMHLQNLITGAPGFKIRAPSSYAVAVVKYDSSGQPLWAASIDSTLWEYSYINRVIAVDMMGNMLLTGSFDDNMNPVVYNGSGVAVSAFQGIGSGTGKNSFLVKYSASGSLLWARSMTAMNTSTTAMSVYTDVSGHVYWCSSIKPGVVADLLDVSGVLITQFPSTLPDDSCVIKFDSSGTLLWKAFVDGSGVDNVTSMAADRSGRNMYFAGNHNSSLCRVCDNSGTPVLSLPAQNNTLTTAYVVQCDSSSGQPLWVATVGSAEGSAYGKVVGTDSSDNVIFAGTVSASGAGFAVRNSSGDNVLTLPATVDLASYVVKYSQSGIPMWCARVDGTGNDTLHGMDIDANDNILVTGVYASTSGAIVYNPSGDACLSLKPSVNSCGDVFIIKFSSSGQPVWAATVNDAFHTAGYTVTTDSSARIYVCGYCNGSGVVFADSSGVALRQLPVWPNAVQGFVTMYQDAKPYALPAVDVSSGVYRKLIVNRDPSGTAAVRDLSQSHPKLAQTFTIPPNKAKEFVWLQNAWREL